MAVVFEGGESKVPLKRAPNSLLKQTIRPFAGPARCALASGNGAASRRLHLAPVNVLLVAATGMPRCRMHV
jgi:hypothetical protein